jgi:hypothetical protein
MGLAIRSWQTRMHKGLTLAGVKMPPSLLWRMIAYPLLYPAVGTRPFHAGFCLQPDVYPVLVHVKPNFFDFPARIKFKQLRKHLFVGHGAFLF